MNKNAGITLVVIAILIIIGWAVYASVGNNASQTASSIDSTTNQTVAPDVTNSEAPTSTPASQVVTVNITGQNFSFNTSTITVNKGDTVKVNFTSQNGTHDFVIDAFNAKTNVIGSGQTQTITFVADKSGSFEYYCSVGNHRAMGMVGTLIVK